ncbi:unnamed protein product, partial [Ectocarpus sp. 12 AP-2014]
QGTSPLRSPPLHIPRRKTINCTTHRPESHACIAAFTGLSPTSKPSIKLREKESPREPPPCSHYIQAPADNATNYITRRPEPHAQHPLSVYAQHESTPEGIAQGT